MIYCRTNPIIGISSSLTFAKSPSFMDIQSAIANLRTCELFERGVGDSTDIVQKEMYTFEDRGNRSLTLRPEGTAPCARAFIEHKIYNQAQPTTWYYMGPMFRYDRPQAGRYRQFHQFGLEVFGSQDPDVDAEVIAILVRIVEKMGIKNGELHLNTVGCPDCRPLYRERLLQYMTPFAGNSVRTASKG